MSRLTESTVRSGARGARSTAAWPTTTEPSSRNETAEGTATGAPAPSLTISGRPSTMRATRL